MSDRNSLGEFEHMIVLALLRLEDRAYGVTVRQEIESRTQREVSIGAVYATLERLETKGYVRSHRGEPTPERGGRSKRFFASRRVLPFLIGKLFGRIARAKGRLLGAAVRLLGSFPRQALLPRHVRGDDGRRHSARRL